MMGHREQMISGDEYDALTPAKRFFNWQAGQRAAIKRAFNKRARKSAKLAPHTPAWNETSYRVMALHIQQASDTGR